MQSIETKIRQFVEPFYNEKDLMHDISHIDRIITCAKESDKAATPKTLEGKIIHDAHLLEGGVYYGIIKSFITGSLRDQSLHETMDYYKDNILNKFKCAIAKNQKELDDLYDISENIIKDVDNNI